MSVLNRADSSPVEKLPKSATLVILRHLFMLSPMKEPKNKSSIGSRIKAARKSNQLTTAQLSRRLGVQTKTLASWQNNLTQPRSNRLAMLAGVLGVTPRWLLVGKGWGPLHRSFF